MIFFSFLVLFVASSKKEVAFNIINVKLWVIDTKRNMCAKGFVEIMLILRNLLP